MTEIELLKDKAESLKTEAGLLQSIAQQLLIGKEIIQDLEQLQLILPHYLYYHASNSAALLLLYHKILTQRGGCPEIKDLIKQESQKYKYWHKKLWRLTTGDFTTELSVLELNSPLYDLLTAGFYMFYLARLPHLLRGSLRKHINLENRECELLGNICRSQIPAKVSRGLNHYLKAHHYLLGQMEQDWQTSLRRIKNNTSHTHGYPANYRWIFEALKRTEGAVEMKFKNQAAEETFAADLGDILGTLVDSLHYRCQCLPDLEDKKIWPISMV